MLSIKPSFLFLFVVLAVLTTSSHASPQEDHAVQHKRAVPFTSTALNKRNLGGKFKDWYLSKMTHNYFCTDTGRLVPVDPDTGHMLLKGLRKRSDFIDDMLGHSKDTESGLCHNPTWVLPQGWTQPIPVTQFLSQYPWMDVDERGQIRLKADYRAWLEQQGAARAAGAANPNAAGGQYAATPAGPGGQVVPDGGVGYVPPSYLNYQTGMGGTTGLGQNNFGNGVAAGTTAHI